MVGYGSYGNKVGLQFSKMIRKLKRIENLLGTNSIDQETEEERKKTLYELGFVPAIISTRNRRFPTAPLEEYITSPSLQPLLSVFKNKKMLASVIFVGPIHHFS